jgi:crotonobetainyl-CoA:carnitine CoA-transferase CaiB-like acyl-CoA transferase
MSGFCDPLAGLHAVAAVALALERRDATGAGLVVEVPQCEVLDTMFAPEHIAVQMGEPVPRGAGNRHPWMAPHNTYPVAGQDRWISLAVGSDDEFAALCRVLDAPKLPTDERFAKAAARKQNEVALNALLAEATAGRDGLELEQALQRAGVMACRVVKGFELPADPNMQAMRFFQELSREVSGRHAYKTWPFRFNGFDASHKRPPPLLGEHNAEVLGELGVGADGLLQLEQAGVIGHQPKGVA